MVKVGVVGLGKMGLSHHAMINAHPGVTVTAVCDATGFLLDVLNKYTGVRTFSDYNEMLNDAELDAVVIATPSKLHASMVRAAIDKGLHVFCEKPFCLNPTDSADLSRLAKEKNLVTQVGYHNRFVAAFQEVRRLLDLGAIGEVSHVLAEAYGPVVLRDKGGTWRTNREEGGGCLYDYAAHPINLVNWYMGMPIGVGGTRLNSVFSQDTDDEVFSTLYYPKGKSAQISVQWSDESYRKMTTRITVWGKCGRVFADRQEIQVYLRDTAKIPEGYQAGWNVRYTTDMTKPVWFYVRGEEYSAQLDSFIEAIVSKRSDNVNSFETAADTDAVIAMMVSDAKKVAPTSLGDRPIEPERRKRRFLFG